MRKRIAYAAVTAVSSLALFAGPAQAAPSICVSLDLNVNGTGQSQNICLPPA